MTWLPLGSVGKMSPIYFSSKRNAVMDDFPHWCKETKPRRSLPWRAWVESILPLSASYCLLRVCPVSQILWGAGERESWLDGLPVSSFLLAHHTPWPPSLATWSLFSRVVLEADQSVKWGQPFQFVIIGLFRVLWGDPLALWNQGLI